jgi:hypothetical protein
MCLRPFNLPVAVGPFGKNYGFPLTAHTRVPATGNHLAYAGRWTSVSRTLSIDKDQGAANAMEIREDVCRGGHC